MDCGSTQLYLQQARLGGDHNDVRVALVLSDGQQVLGGRGRTELEGCAGTPDVASVGHIAKLVELAIRFGDVVTWQAEVTRKKMYSVICEAEQDHFALLSYIIQCVLH